MDMEVFDRAVRWDNASLVTIILIIYIKFVHSVLVSFLIVAHHYPSSQAFTRFMNVCVLLKDN